MSESWANKDGLVIRYGPRLKCEEYPEAPSATCDADQPTSIKYKYFVDSKTGELCRGYGPLEKSE
jgi:hypothetical protein